MSFLFLEVEDGVGLLPGGLSCGVDVRTSAMGVSHQPSVVGKGRKQEVRVCLPRTMGISLGDSTALQKYLDLVDWSNLDVFPTELKPQENMK